MLFVYYHAKAGLGLPVPDSLKPGGAGSSAELALAAGARARAEPPTPLKSSDSNASQVSKYFFLKPYYLGPRYSSLKPYHVKDPKTCMLADGRVSGPLRSRIRGEGREEVVKALLQASQALFNSGFRIWLGSRDSRFFWTRRRQTRKGSQELCNPCIYMLKIS